MKENWVGTEPGDQIFEKSWQEKAELSTYKNAFKPGILTVAWHFVKINFSFWRGKLVEVGRIYFVYEANWYTGQKTCFVEGGCSAAACL